MTSKEALERLVGKTSILDDTCASLENCIKCGKCRYNEPCETCDDYNLVMTIKQDIERLEKIEKENQTNKDFIKIQNEILKIKEDENTKLKKIIELILNKCVIELHIKVSKNVEEYNKWNTKCFQLTQEEYNLLKEWLK